MCRKNEELLTILEDTTVKKIVKEYEKFKKKLDIFHVAFSGGKDSAVLLDLVKKALPIGSFVVIFGDTGMEFPDTYHVVELTRQQCEDCLLYTSLHSINYCRRSQIKWKLQPGWNSSSG